jgi:hypothetical protein
MASSFETPARAGSSERENVWQRAFATAAVV